MQINKGIITSANINIRQALIPAINKCARTQRQMIAEYITIHNTANSGATAKQNSDYVVGQNGYISWHFTVGNNEVYQQLPINETGYHCGDGEDGVGNTKSIGVEVAEVYGTDKTIVKFVAELMKATGIPIDKVVPHKYWTGKNCPRLILPHWDDFINDIKSELGEVEIMKTEFVRYKNMTELKGDPSKLQDDIVDKKIWDITEFTNFINGSFYWYNKDGSTYPTSPLIINGVIKRNEANHYYDFGCPQNVFIVYNNGKVEMKKVYFANQLDYKNIKMAVGGVGLRDITNPNFKYDPASEGFKKGINRLTGETVDYSDVLRKTNKSVIGYSFKTGKAYLLTVKLITHTNLIKTISVGESYDIALSVDGGGSTLMDALGEYVFQGENTRRINNIIRFV